MSEIGRTTKDVVNEKYADRGWDREKINNNTLPIETIKPLPLTEEEYDLFSFLLSKLALGDKDSNLCALYFELQRRAVYGNRYFTSGERAIIEQQMWLLGIDESVEDVEKHVL